MPLYDRIIGAQENIAKIPVHGFQAVLAEFARGRINGTQAQSIIETLSGAPLTPEEVQEANTLLGSITGNATAKLARVTEIDHVLMLAEFQAPGYDTSSSIKTRLGV